MWGPEVGLPSGREGGKERGGWVGSRRAERTPETLRSRSLYKKICELVVKEK